MTNTQVNRTLAVIVAFTFLLGMATIALIVKAKADLAPSLAQQTIFSCVREDANAHTADAVALLIAAGWQATPVDHREALYSPACNIEVREDGTYAIWNTEGELVYGG